MIAKLKRELHYQYRCLRLAAGMVGRRLIHCNLQVTYRCNFQCRICDFWKPMYDKSHELSLADVRIIGEKLNRLGTLIISLAGGEPLIREDLPEIIRILNQANHFPVLITNGWYVDEPFGRAILQAGLQEISVSVDYATPAKHDAQRGREGAWDRAIRALEILHRHRPDHRNRVHMISVLMDDNIDEVEPMIRIARELGVTYMINLYSWNRGTKAFRLPRGGVTRRLLELKRKYPEFVTLTSYIERFDRALATGGIGDCQTGRLLLNVDRHGNVARCTETLDEPVGNLLTGDVRAIRDRLIQVQKASTCAQCWTSCRGFAECIQKRPRLRQFKEFFTSVRPRA